MRARWTKVFALAAMGALIALPASADEHLDPADRVLVHGYDPGAMQLLWTEMMGDSATVEDDCDITEGNYEYVVEGDGSITLTLVDDETDGEEGDEGEEGGEGELPEECNLNTTDVQGPQGQVNHGTVVSSFVQDLKEHLAEAEYEGGIGCYVRVIAQSDYGKGDQQVKVSDIDPDAEPAETTEGEAELTVSETTCNGNGNEDASASGRPDHAGPPEDAGPPPHAKNKSESNGKGGPPNHAQGPKNR